MASRPSLVRYTALTPPMWPAPGTRAPRFCSMHRQAPAPRSHTPMLLSYSTTTAVAPSREAATDLTRDPMTAGSVATCSCVCRSHVEIWRSPDARMRRLPSSRIWPCRRAALCPCSHARQHRSPAVHSFGQPTCEKHAATMPSRRSALETELREDLLTRGQTQAHTGVLTWKVACRSPLAQFQTRARPSPPRDAAVLPSGLTVMPRTLPECVGAVVRSWAARSHTTAVASVLAVTANLQAGIKSDHNETSTVRFTGRRMLQKHCHIELNLRSASFGAM